MVVFLSIDVGIKNLALCCINKSEMSDILYWDCIDISQSDPCPKSTICTQITRKGSVCSAKAKYIYQEEYSCIRHYKTLGISQSDYKKIKATKKKAVVLQDLAKNVITCLESVYKSQKSVFDSIELVHIELQPSVNNKMKFLSHIIFGKFVDLLRESNIKIRFVSASHKLKYFRGPKEIVQTKKYSDRKKSSIKCARWYLENCVQNNETWVAFFDSHKKTDDLADTLCMVMNER
jgi:hypothetical protein